MDWLSRITGLLTGRKTLASVALDDLRKERIRLEQAELKLSREIEQFEQQKHELFQQGRLQTNQRQQIALARKIKELDASSQAKDRQSAMISRQMRVLSGLVMVKENEQLMRDLGVSSIISRMDLGELEQYLDRATVQGQLQMERFAHILQAMEGQEGLAGEQEDEDTLAIVAAMQEARDVESLPPETEVSSEDAQSVDKEMDTVNRILRGKAQNDSQETGPG